MDSLWTELSGKPPKVEDKGKWYWKVKKRLKVRRSNYKLQGWKFCSQNMWRESDHATKKKKTPKPNQTHMENVQW